MPCRGLLAAYMAQILAKGDTNRNTAAIRFFELGETTELDDRPKNER